MDPKIAGWKAAREREKRKFAKRMARGRYWKNRWKVQPDFMRANLNALIETNKAKWKRRREKTEEIVRSMPEVIPSWELRNELTKAVQRPPFNVAEPTKQEIQKLVVRIRLYGLMRFDHETLCWHLANVSPR